MKKGIDVRLINLISFSCFRQKIPRSSTAHDFTMPGQELRHRRRGRSQNQEPQSNGDLRGMGRGAGARPSSEEVEVRGAMGDLLSAGSTISGCLVMIALSYQFSRYLCQLHENDLWFSEIMVRFQFFNRNNKRITLSGGRTGNFI